MPRTLKPRTRKAADWTADVRFYEYTKAADPKMPAVPFAVLSSELTEVGKTRIIPFDLSAQLQCDGPATTPNLMASFVRIAAGEKVRTDVDATSQLFYIVRGKGRTSCEHGSIQWNEGDLFVLPATGKVAHTAAATPGNDVAIYWVHDEPLLHYLGVTPHEPRFKPTLFRKDRLTQELTAVASEPGAENRNRRGILLGNAATPLTLTISHTLWALLNVLPAGVVQPPHRHNSVALDLCIDAAPGTYTMIGAKLDRAKRAVIDGTRAEWVPGCAFVTPPGLWHSHHNESTKDALVLPIQDAGLCTYMRLLDIQFA